MADMRKPSILTIVIHPVSDEPFVGKRKAEVVDFHPCLGPGVIFFAQKTGEDSPI
jgi:hypothetical protein